MSIYVSKNGSNIAPYDTPATAANSVLSAIASITAQGSIVYIAEGVYAETSYISLGASKYTGTQIIGCDADFNQVSDADHVTIITAHMAVYSSVANVNDVKISGINFRYGGSAKNGLRLDAATSGWQLNDVLIEPNAGETAYYQPFRVANAVGMTLTRVRLRSGQNVDGQAAFRASGASAIVADELTIEGHNGQTGWLSSGVSAEGSSSIHLRRSVVAAGLGTAVSNAGTGAVVVEDCPLIMGGATYSVRNYSTGSVTVSGSNIASSGFSPVGKYIDANVTDAGGNIFSGFPRFEAYARKGFIVPCVDDGNLAQYNYVRALSDMMAGSGMCGTWYYYTKPGSGFSALTNNADAENLRQIVRDGVWEVGCHTWSHSNVTIAAAEFGALSKSGGVSPQYKIDRTANVFSFIDNGVQHDIALSTDNSESISTVVSAINSIEPGWVITTNASILTSTAVRISSIKDTGGFVDVSVPLLFDKESITSGFYIDEIYEPKRQIEGIMTGVTDPQTGVSYTCNSFAEPGGPQDEMSRNAVIAAGYLGARPSGGAFGNLSSVDLFRRGFSWVDSEVLGSTAAETIGNVNSICAHAAMHGALVFLLAHSETECPLTGDNSWETILGALRRWHDAGAVSVTSAQSAYIALRNAPWSFSAGISTRSYGDAYPVLKYDNASFWSAFSGTMPDLSLSADSPASLKSVQVWEGLPSEAQMEVGDV